MSDIQYTYPLIQNKVAPPHYVTPTLRRARLLDWLHAATTCRATVIAAGAGYGKTTLLWQWEREVDFPIYWYKLDRNDRDWTLHISYLIEAISQRHRGFGRRAHSMLQQLGGPGSSRPGVAAYLLSEMHDTLKEPCTFIIDDWQYVASQTEVRGLWNQILRDAPATCRFVFASRAKPQLQFARFKTHAGYAELRTDALRFTDVEIDELFRDVYNDPLDATELAELERRTEGWAASLQLVEVSLRERKTRQARRDFIESITATTDSDLFEFLAEEVLDQQAEQIRNFLLCTSILQRIEPELAERIAGIHEGARQLADLEQRGLFTYRLGPDDARYRYHNLFREFLERQLIAERPSSEVTGLHIHAASYFETHEEWPQAIHHYLRAGLQPQAARLIAKYGEDVAAEGRIGLIDEWLVQLPAKTIHDNARLSLLHGEALGIRGEFGASLAALERARGFFSRKGDRRMEALACLKLSSVYHNTGEMATSARLAEEGLELVPDDARATKLRLQGNIAITSTLMDDGVEAAVRACKRVTIEAASAGLDHFAAIGYHNVGVLQRTAGMLHESAASLGRAAKFWSELPASPFADNRELVLTHLMLNDVRRADEIATRAEHATRPWPHPQAHARFARAAVSIQRGNFAEAVEVLQEILLLGSQLGGLAYEAYGLLLEAFHLGRYAPSESASILELLSTVIRDPRLRPMVDPAEAIASHTLHRCNGLCHEVRETLNRWDARGARAWVTVGIAKLGPALLDHEAGKATNTVITSLDRAAQLGLMPYLKWWLRDYLRHVGLLGKTEQGTRVLARFLEADPEYWRVPLVGLLAKMKGSRREVLLAALVKFANKATVIALGEISGADVDEARKHLARQQAPRLLVRTFGTLGLHRGSWSSQIATLDKRRLRILLGLLASHSRSALPRETAIDVLWPEAMPAAAVNNLNQSVFQLRRVLDEQYRDGESPSYIITTSDSLQLDSQLVRVDLDEFRAVATRLRSGASGGDFESAARTAVDLVRGGFLADLKYEDWVQPLTDAVHAEVREVLFPLASSTASSPDLAVRAGCALMALDEYDESAVVVTAHQLAQAGRHTAARQLIGRFAKKLQDELDEEPSAAVVAAMKALGYRPSPSTST
jgi:ATP/maltotriose-dependent transcriptional regulator MalT/DNA-binding SARP family transcriptional activator